MRAVRIQGMCLLTCSAGCLGLSGKRQLFYHGIRIGFLASKNREVKARYPAIANGHTLSPDGFYLYKWPDWNSPKYHERLKKSYYYMKDTFGQVDVENQ